MVIWTYNPAVRKIPVKILFCRVEVRRRHSRGTGLTRGQKLTDYHKDWTDFTKQTIMKSSRVLTDPDTAKLFLGFMQ